MYIPIDLAASLAQGLYPLNIYGLWLLAKIEYINIRNRIYILYRNGVLPFKTD